MHTKALCMKLECKINRLYGYHSRSMRPLFCFNIIRCKFFFGVFRLTPLWFCHSWNWSQMIFFVLMKEVRFVLKLVSTGKWASQQGNYMAPVIFLSHDHYFIVGTFEGFSPKRGKTVFLCHFLWKRNENTDCEWIHWKGLTNFFLYFCHDLAIKALLCTWKCILCSCKRVSSIIVNLCKSACKLLMKYGVRQHNSIVFDWFHCILKELSYCCLLCFVLWSGEFDARTNERWFCVDSLHLSPRVWLVGMWIFLCRVFKNT